ncbi:alpha/beta fold hydrolase [[Erwinia] mediterraneensis]|uniref:alpha/beta fold hydrolase n=1 Tax=[Erwinia] mediterraneensis TaxID=2161819 RepID=UPI0010304E43|nr:alpha/beta hydrolase [[Erwinia] mediterraneensis]
MYVTVKKSFFEFEGMQVGFYYAGRGKPLLLIHGSGPGASSLGNWGRVLEPLAKDFTVYAMDLIGFGISDRKPEKPYFDFEMWVRQAKAMIDFIDADEIGLIGHSLSAAIALKAAASDTRIKAVLTTGAIGASFKATQATQRIWRCPKNRDELISTLGTLIHDKSVIDEEYIRAREPVVFQKGYAEYFDEMFTGEPQQYVEKTTLSIETLSAVNCPVIMLHGRDDIPFPPSSSEMLSKHIRQADLQILNNCSHSVVLERNDAFMAAVKVLF